MNLSHLRQALLSSLIVVSSPFLVHCSHVQTKNTSEQIAEFSREYQRLSIPLNYDSWDAYAKGAPESYDKMAKGEKALNDFLSSPRHFANLKALREQAVKKPQEFTANDRRQIEIFLNYFAANQVDSTLLNEITDLSTKIQQEFNTFRVKVGDKLLSEIELRDILKHSTDSKVLKEAWEASKAVGERVEADLKKLVKLRNEKAKRLGYKNFHDMSLALDEHTTAHLLAFFEEVDQATKANFRKAKAEFEIPLAKRLGIAVADLRPWHYQEPFFQEPPDVGGVSLDSLYEKADIKVLTEKYYEGLGLPLPGVFEKSDLYPRDKKSTHAFCYDLDREGDTRVLANITKNDRWMATMLHEFGHAVYSATYIPKSLPFLLRDAAHTLTTEGLAMLFERESKRKAWLAASGLLPPDDKTQKAIVSTAKRQMRSRLLVFARWAQVMFHFEKKMYENPEADLNKLWWDLVEKYQELKRPEGRNKPDYAAKVHVVTAPVYYHNYLMGEVFASQVHHAMAKEVGNGADPNAFTYAGKKGIGTFVQKRILDLGRVYAWPEMIEKATGEKLNLKGFAYDTK